MPRTKQKAKLSTGGVAPREQLRRTEHMARITATRMREEVATQTKAPAKQTKKRTTGGLAPRSSWIDGLMDTDSEPKDEVSPAVIAPFIPDGEYSENSCFLCMNGGNLVVCSRCVRACCDVCIKDVVSINTQQGPTGSVWICPACHISDDRRRGRNVSTPYYGFYNSGDSSKVPTISQPLTIVGSSQATLNSRICTSATLILHFVLSSIVSAGTPAILFADYLGPSFQESTLIFQEFSFSLDSADSQSSHLDALHRFMSRIPRSIARVYIFVTTHSDDDTGELFIEPNGRAPLEQFCSGVISQVILSYCETRSASLFFLVCGSFVNVPVSLAKLKELASRHRFQDVFAFTAAGLLFSLAGSFFMEYAQSVVLDGFSSRAVLHSLLSSSRTLTRHSNIVHIQTAAAGSEVKTVVRKYVWTHKTIRPNGKTLPVQCQSCKSIGSWQCVSGDASGGIRVSCRGQVNGQACSQEWIANKITSSKIDDSKAGIWTEELL